MRRRGARGATYHSCDNVLGIVRMRSAVCARGLPRVLVFNSLALSSNHGKHNKNEGRIKSNSWIGTTLSPAEKL